MSLELIQHQLEETTSRIDLNQLTPEVRSYFDGLITQAQGILKTYNGKLDTAPIEILERLQSLITKLKHVAKTKEIPPEDNPLLFKYTTLEGKEVILDLEKIFKESHTFYQEHNLINLTQELPTTIKLSSEDRTRIQEALEQGFNKAFFFPSADILSTQRDKIIEECTNKPLEGLSDIDQYTTPSIDDIVKTATSHNRPTQKSYLLLYFAENPPQTKFMTYPQAEEYFKTKNWNGLTEDEYLILQRKECQENNNHQFDTYNTNPDQSQCSWLLDASVLSGRVFAYWIPDNHQVGLYCGESVDCLPYIGARPSVVVELEQ